MNLDCPHLLKAKNTNGKQQEKYHKCEEKKKLKRR